MKRKPRRKQQQRPHPVKSPARQQLQRRQSAAETARLASFPLLNPQPVIEVGLDGQVRFANAAAQRLFPDLPQRGGGHPWLADWATVVRNCRESGGNIPSREVEVGGRWYHQALYFEPAAKSIRIFGVDITAGKRAERELALAKEDWERTFDSVPDLIAIMDDQHRIRRANRAMAQRLGLTVEQCIGQACYGCVHGTDCPPASCPHSLTLADGREHLAEIHEDRLGGDFLVSTTPLLDAQGVLIGSVHVARDITARKTAEQATVRLAAIVESSDDAILSKDLEGNILSWNAGAERLFGYRADEVIGQRITLLLPPERHAEEAQILERLQRGERVEHLETVRLAKDGRCLQVSVTSSPIKDRDGRVVGVSKIVRDISARKQAEEQIRQLNVGLEQRVRERTAELVAANKELEAFCYSVSHDLRAPLRSIDGFSQAVLEDYADKLDATGSDFLQRVRAGCQRMGHLIDDLLDLSRLTRAEMRREPVSLTALAQAAAQELQQAAPERSVQFRIAAGLSAVGDAQLLRAALWNLLENAWKFTGGCATARIEVGTVSADESRATNHHAPVFFVRDNGTGFDMKYAHKLFGPFQRLHAMEEFPGTCVGLATVQRIIHRHGGRVWSEGAVGHGATFYFTLEPEEEPHGQ